MSLANQLRSLLQGGLVNFTYQKKNGECRSAVGTLNQELFSYEFVNKSYSPKPDMITYWDLNKKGWRSFHDYQLISIDNEEFQS